MTTTKLTMVKHVRSGKPTRMTIDAKPMTLWLGRNVELELSPGARLETVAEIIHETLEVPRKRAFKLAAFYFAIGERRAGKRPNAPTFSKAELNTDRTRRYLKVDAG